MTTITLRGVPADLKRRLTARARAAGLSLSDFMRREFDALAAAPTEAELRARLEALPPPDAT